MDEIVKPLPGAGLLRVAGSKRLVLPREIFEIEAEAFLAKRLAPGLFLETCNAALGSFEGRQYECLIYKYRYLTHMALERYYEALSDALSVLKKCRDEPLHCRMMGTVYLRRRNFETALEYMRRGLHCAATQGDGLAELEDEARQVESIAGKTLRLSEDALRSGVRKHGAALAARYAGQNLLLSGRARVCVDSQTGALYLIFFGQPGQLPVYCRMAGCEAPFIRHVSEASPVRVCASLLAVGEGNILMAPCHYVE